METKPHILVVDDDDRLRSLLRKFLSDHGFMITAAANADAELARAKKALETAGRDTEAAPPRPRSNS